jgi:hypothetical protein
MCVGDCRGTSGGAGCQNPLVDLAKRLQKGEGTATALLQAEQSASGQSTGGGAADSRPTAAKAKRSPHKAPLPSCLLRLGHHLGHGMQH